jgi:hypothetical protein
MKWRWLGRLLDAVAAFQHEPERSALRELGGELAELDGTA